MEGDDKVVFKTAKSLGETRTSRHLLTDFEAFSHIAKGTVGTGILASPMAFKKMGTWAGLITTILLGALVYYGQHMLIKCNHAVCWRVERPFLTYEDLMEESFKTGPKRSQKLAKCSKYLVLTVLGTFMFGCCCVYVVFIAVNVKAVVKDIWIDLDVRIYMVMVLLPVILLDLIKTLKFMAPASIIGVFIMALVLSICSYYIGKNYKSPFNQPGITPIQDWPVYFGLILFGLEGVSTLLPVENSMKKPEHLVKCPCLILIELILVTSVTSAFGFFGFIAYGKDTQATISLNLPNDWVSKVAQLLLSVAMFLSIAIHFYVPYRMIHDRIKHKLERHPTLYDFLLRCAISVIIVLIAIAVPRIGPFITLLGAVSQATLGLTFPALLDIIIFWENPGMGFANWRLVKNIGIMMFGICGAILGSALSIKDIVSMYTEHSSP